MDLKLFYFALFVQLVLYSQKPLELRPVRVQNELSYKFLKKIRNFFAISAIIEVGPLSFNEKNSLRQLFQNNVIYDQYKTNETAIISTLKQEPNLAFLFINVNQGISPLETLSLLNSMQTMHCRNTVLIIDNITFFHLPTTILQLKRTMRNDEQIGQCRSINELIYHITLLGYPKIIIYGNMLLAIPSNYYIYQQPHIAFSPCLEAMTISRLWDDDYRLDKIFDSEQKIISLATSKERHAIEALHNSSQSPLNLYAKYWQALILSNLGINVAIQSGFKNFSEILGFGWDNWRIQYHMALTAKRLDQTNIAKGHLDQIPDEIKSHLQF